MSTDSISDLFVSLRNAIVAGHSTIIVPYSTLKERVLDARREVGALRTHAARLGEVPGDIKLRGDRGFCGTEEGN